MKDAGRDDVQNVTAGAEGDGMACIVSALVAGDAVEAVGKDIDNLTLALITPLKTDNGDVFLHDIHCGIT
jgi:hypothetical protein